MHCYNFIYFSAEAAKLKSQGVNIIIALGHSGFEKDKQIAAECPEVDLVVGGHTNTFLFNGNAPDIEVPIDVYPVIVQSNGKRVPVIQAFAYTKYLGALELTFNTQGDVVSFSGQPILLDSSIAQADDVLSLLTAFRPNVAALETLFIGKSRVYIDGNEKSCRKMECNMGNMITDAMIWSYANFAERKDKYIPLALMQGGGIRSSIDTKLNDGQISQADIINVLPFGSTLAIITLTGAELLQAFEHSVERYSNIIAYGEFLQVSGIRVVYDMDKKPNKRVQSVELLCDDCTTPQYEPLKETQKYRILTTNYLLEGLDGFTMFKNKGSALNIKDVDSLSDYIKQMAVVYPGIESRIEIVGTADEPDGAATIVLSTSLLLLSMLSYILRVF